MHRVRYIRLDDGQGESFLDPREYVARLPELGPRLPPGAREFATDPRHYDFSGRRCVKDLKLQAASPHGVDDFELRFKHNCFKHEEDLTITYRGLRGIQMDVDTEADIEPFALALDEVLPDPAGCRHEIAFWGGTIFVLAQDLIATWTEADCPDKPPATRPK